MEERLQKILSRCGVASRRKAEELILSGKVTVDGETVTELGAKYEAARHKIAVEGRVVKKNREYVYLLLNKPKGYVSTTSDERGRPTVIDLLKGTDKVKRTERTKRSKSVPDAGYGRIYPVGRLDNNTEGLLILTNDGELTNALLHPKYEIEKTYIAKVVGALDAEHLNRLRGGVELKDGFTAPAKVKLISFDGAFSRLELKIHEGRNREIRRMIEAIGSDVRSLKRTHFAFLDLTGVKRGQYRELSPKEVAKLYELTGHKSPLKLKKSKIFF